MRGEAGSGIARLPQHWRAVAESENAQQYRDREEPFGGKQWRHDSYRHRGSRRETSQQATKFELDFEVRGRREALGKGEWGQGHTRIIAAKRNRLLAFVQVCSICVLRAVGVHDRR